jgi:hypothetical protein
MHSCIDKKIEMFLSTNKINIDHDEKRQNQCQETEIYWNEQVMIYKRN